MITKVWYVVENGGDGSCCVRLCESEGLANLFNSLDDESYDEAVDSFEIEHDGDIKIKDMLTIDDAIAEASDDINESWWGEDEQERLDKFLKLKENPPE